MHLNKLAKVMRTAGEETRLEILCTILNNQDICVSDLAKKLGLSVAIVSHHLQVMSKEGLLSPKRNGKKICYEFPKNAFVNDLKKFICKYK